MTVVYNNSYVDIVNEFKNKIYDAYILIGIYDEYCTVNTPEDTFREYYDKYYRPCYHYYNLGKKKVRETHQKNIGILLLTENHILV